VSLNFRRLADPQYDIGSYARIRRRDGVYTVRGSHHRVTPPTKPSTNLAILYGLVCGDGSLTCSASATKRGKWRIDYCEPDPTVVSEYVRLTREVFGLTPIVRKRRNWIEVYFCSKIVYRFYSRILGHPMGKKTGSLRIPSVFKRRSRLLFGFLKGLFTAEGSVKEERNVRIFLAMQEPRLVSEVASALRSAKFHPHQYWYSMKGRRLHCVYVYGLEDARRFGKQIGFVGHKSLRLAKVIRRFERRASSPE
jgi:hypothetical protein